jgi:serralysin
MAIILGNSAGQTLKGTAYSDSLQGFGGDDFLYGYGGNDTLEGGAGADFMSGGTGNDLLIGGAGADRLSGGSGRDIFVFSDLSSDTISDFVSGTDKVDLGALIGSQFHFIGGAGFHHQAGEGRYADGHFQLDLNGDGVADLTIAMGAVHASDFVFAAYGAWDY